MLSDSAAATIVELERSHGQALFGFICRAGIDRSRAADIVQESLLRLYRQLSYGAQIEDALAWTFRTGYRLAIDEHRRDARGRRYFASRIAPQLIEDAADEIVRRQVWEVVDRLPDRQRAVVYLRYRADLSFDSIGTVLGITASAARSHVTQALGSMRRTVEREGVV